MFTTADVVAFGMILALLVYVWFISPYRFTRPLDKLPGTKDHDPRR